MWSGQESSWLVCNSVGGPGLGPRMGVFGNSGVIDDDSDGLSGCVMH